MWKKIPGFSAYEISEFGQIRRSLIQIKRCGHRKRPGGLLKHCGKYGSYALVNDNGKIIRELRTNRLMLLTFVGPPPTSKHQALHWDDDQTNNSIDNLRWGLPKDNGADSVRNGKSLKGVKNAAAKLTEEQVLAMREDYRNGKSLNEIATAYGMSLSIWAAITGKAWAHLPNPVARKGQGAREKHQILRGSANGNSKLNEDQVRMIKQLLPTHTGVALAKKFNTTTHTISAIKRGVVWRHITEGSDK